MGRIRASILRRGAALAAVVAIHALLFTALMHGLRRRASTPPEEFISTWIVLPADLSRRRFGRLGASKGVPPMVLRPMTVEPLPVPQLVAPDSSETRIDWDAEGRRAAEHLIAAPQVREFGRAPGEIAPAEQRPAPAHYAGETYTDVFGDRVYWVSDRCYLVEGSPLAAAIAGLNHPGPAPGSLPGMSCVSSAAPAGELFKDLPAYQKNRPQ